MELVWSVLAGASFGGIAGFLSAHIDLWSKRVRDRRADDRGEGLASDYVYKRWRWLAVAVAGAGFAAALSATGMPWWFNAAQLPVLILLLSLLDVLMNALS